MSELFRPVAHRTWVTGHKAPYARERGISGSVET